MQTCKELATCFTFIPLDLIRMALALTYSILSLVLFTNLDRFLFSFLVSLNFTGLMRPHDYKMGWHRFPSLIRQNHLNKLTELDLDLTVRGATQGQM